MTATETAESEIPQTDRTQLVRYAADCAERVLHLAGPLRPNAEAAIQAARAWAESPTEERRQACRETADRAYLDSVLSAAFVAVFGDRTVKKAHSSAVLAAALAGKAAVCGDSALFAAGAAEAATGVRHTGSAPGAERAWQAERRKFYGLPAPNAGGVEG